MYCPPRHLRAIHPGTRCPGLPPHHVCNDDAAFYLVAPTDADAGRPTGLPLCRSCADHGLLELRRIDHPFWSVQPTPILVRHPPYGFIHPATLHLYPVHQPQPSTPAALPAVYPATSCSSDSCQLDAAFYVITPDLEPLPGVYCRYCATAQLSNLLSINPFWAVAPAPIYLLHPTRKTLHPYAGDA